MRKSGEISDASQLHILELTLNAETLSSKAPLQYKLMISADERNITNGRSLFFHTVNCIPDMIETKTCFVLIFMISQYCLKIAKYFNESTISLLPA